MPQEPLQGAPKRTQNNILFLLQELAATRNRLAVQCTRTARRV